MSDEIHLDKYPQETLMELTGAITDGNEEEDQAAQKEKE